jgi:lipoyl-dependent peroxiredoxin
MPRIVREADVTWGGDLTRGAGALTAATSGAFTTLPYSLPTRVGAAEGKTSPEELLAAAHAGCFAMSLASELTEAGTPPERLDVRCTITMDEVEGAGHRIVASAIEARVRVLEVSQEAFAALAERADAGWPFSHLIRASESVTVAATLESQAQGVT